MKRWILSGTVRSQKTLRRRRVFRSRQYLCSHRSWMFLEM